MREALDEWSNYVTLIEITMVVETSIGEAIRDAELEGVQTLRDLARVVERHLSSDPDCEARAIALVKEAARTVLVNPAGEANFDERFIDAIHPNRWSV